jgi:type VI secretion system ImpM family protein
MDLAHGYYGKLPEFEDFVKCSMESESIKLFIEWFDASMGLCLSKYGENLEGTFNQSKPLCFIFQQDNAPHALIGICVSSHDKAGRFFPFSLFIEIGSKTFGQQLFLVPESYKFFLQISRYHLKNLKDSFSFTKRRHTLWTLGEGLPLDSVKARMAFIKVFAETPLKRFLQNIDRGHDKPIALQTLRNLFYSLSPLEGKFPENFQAIFRFPISMQYEYHGLEIGFWLSCTEALVDKLPQDFNIFWTHNILYLVFGPLNNNTLTTLWPVPENNDRIWDFAGMQLDQTQSGDDIDTMNDLLSAIEELPLEQIINLFNRNK